VVAAINGAALGGGLEIALACHHRVALAAPHVRIGFPEVTLGLLPGAGGVVRTVRLLGLQPALDELLLSGTAHPSARALELGLVDQLAPSPEDLAAAAHSLAATATGSAAPWDRPGYQIPGTEQTPVAALAAPLTAALTKKLRGAPFPAPFAILSTAIEGAQLDFEHALANETQYFVSLLVSQTAKNMMQGHFVDLQAVRSGAARPAGVPRFEPGRLGVIGAGMMGAGLAYISARAGLPVVLHDVSVEAAERGKDYSRNLVRKQTERGQLTAEQGEELLSLIRTTVDLQDLAGVDAVIEAVYEDPDLKQHVYGQIAEHTWPTLFASNTSTLPISGLAKGTPSPSSFLGMHFFSPVDKMPLVEIVIGEQTSEETLARAFDLALRLSRVPIAVNDGRGFFTSRVIGQRVDETMALVGEGVPPITVERAATQLGYPAGTLQLIDETTLSLPHKVRIENRKAAAADGRPWTEHPGERVMTLMVEQFNRPGRSAGAGFYEYVDGRRSGLWPGLAEHFGGQAELPFTDIQDRIIFAEALETARCFEDGVLRSAADANVGSVLGLGFPRWTGGVAQFMNGYPGGLAAFATRAHELAKLYGDRFRPSAWLDEQAAGQDAKLGQ
jgi:3-hydroxyacyl-CoA dehydrogenase/enoyl-CoA hydratase/3-hydroxybutyryl-CoA epimerase